MNSIEREMQGKRLREARLARKLSALDVYKPLGIHKSTYSQYESGRLGLSQVVQRIARKLNCNADWLLTGRGEPFAKNIAPEIEIHGVVGAGSSIIPITDDTAAVEIGSISFPEVDDLGALVVKGESGYPRFQDGETIVFYRRQLSPAEVANHEAVVQTWDGRKMVKRVLPDKSNPGKYILESRNAPTEYGVDLMCGWRIHSILLR